MYIATKNYDFRGVCRNLMKGVAGADPALSHDGRGPGVLELFLSALQIVHKAHC